MVEQRAQKQSNSADKATPEKCPPTLTTVNKTEAKLIAKPIRLPRTF